MTVAEGKRIAEIRQFCSETGYALDDKMVTLRKLLNKMDTDEVVANDVVLNGAKATLHRVYGLSKLLWHAVWEVEMVLGEYHNKIGTLSEERIADLVHHLEIRPFPYGDVFSKAFNTNISLVFEHGKWDLASRVGEGGEE